ncbi:TPA: hypothetical protein DD425_03590 [Candidatus Saccharibacteria bacterium]|nr:hypothetical protein [Candidatus Saccharibacteria bacterium]|tara:strand:- start:908 stop:1285 length:378 start_codon:yes stop_codon:yes gene_type:complete
MEYLAYIGLLLLLALSVFQLLLIVGAPFGKCAWGGKVAVLPAKLRAASAISILLYGIFAAFLVSKAGIAPIIPGGEVLSVGMWVFTGYFFIGIGMNAISKSKNERIVMTPVAALLAIIFLLVALH